MTKREFWLKLFNENDAALACAIHLCERYINNEQLESGEEFISQKRRELYEEVSQETIVEVFGQASRACFCEICGRYIESDWEKHNPFPVRSESDFACPECQVKYVKPIRLYCRWKNIDYNGIYDRVCGYTVKELDKFIGKENKGNPFMS